MPPIYFAIETAIDACPGGQLIVYDVFAETKCCRWMTNGSIW